VSGRFKGASAEGYDRGFGSVSGQFIPALLRAARVSRNHRVLDIATGTGAAAAAVVELIGLGGQVTAADLSPAMLAQARERLGNIPNVSLAIEDGQSLTISDGAFDAVLCSMGLMFFPDPARGLAEFRRVLCEGGWAAVSVNTTPEQAFVTRVDAIIGRHARERAAAAARCFSLGTAHLLRPLFEAAGFRDVEIFTETRRFPFGSFAEYFEPIEAGLGPTGQAFVTLPTSVQDAVREDTRRQLEREGVSGGPIEVEVTILFGSGRK
jgi:ubiquinone/menaquinone biosynthesis C-methylase UbiE